MIKQDITRRRDEFTSRRRVLLCCIIFHFSYIIIYLQIFSAASSFLPFDMRRIPYPFALILSSLVKGELLLLSQAQRTIEGSFAPNLSACAITSADNPSVTVTKNSVLCQIIVILTYKATSKMLCYTVTAPFTQGS